MTTRRWSVEFSIGALLAAAIIWTGVLGLLIWRWPTGIDPARVYRACEQYASLDLSGWAAICKDAGYQQHMTPKDLDR